MTKQNSIVLVALLFVTMQTFSQTKLVFESEENDQRVYDLGMAIDESIVNSDVGDFMSKMAISQFNNNIQKKVNEFSSNIKITDEFFDGIKIGIESMPKKIIQNVESGSYYDFISYRYEPNDKAYYMLFRLFSDESGLNYHDYRICEVEGELKFKDIYVYTTGELLSETFGRMYINTIPEKRRTKLFSKSNFKEFSKFLNAVSLFSDGNYEEAYRKIKPIKGDFTKEKYFFLFKSQIASNIGDEEYLDALKEMVDMYPDDSTLYLNYIDYYILLENYEKALGLVNDLQFQTDDDFLHYMKGNIEFSIGNFEKASENYKYLTENYTDFFLGYSSYIGSLNIEKRFETLIELLIFMVEDGYDKLVIIEYIEELDEEGYNQLEDLVNSIEYQNWKKSE